MPKTLAPIPADTEIVDQAGTITIFFRYLWQALIDSFGQSPTVATAQQLAKTAAIGTTAAYTTLAAGLYRISYYLQRTIDDGAASSATVTLGWTTGGVPLTEVEVALTELAGLRQQSGSKLVYADQATDLTYAVAYASTTPNKMTFRIDVMAEQMA